ncbi:efflux RND transporter periplasmic adaptor subunit [Lacrimispora sp.]|uniref:efflux RND transporter periplasmic adaptor subunit n=1 Tax=Lacrimispora sp. TaxID=2719234 RepID=UPI0039924496
MIKNKKKVFVTALVIAAAGGGFFLWMQMKKETMAENQNVVNTVKVTKGNITSELKASGTLEAKNTYKITSMVEGEILSADFSEGDQVEKGQVLYEIDKSGMDSELSGAENTLNRAAGSLEQTKKLYEDSRRKYSGNTYKAQSAGYVKELYIQAGSKVDSGTKIADLYSDRIMKLKIPFLSGDAATIGKGMPAVITLADTGEQINGTVDFVSSQEVALTGGRLVRNVTISVQNPGGLTADTKASASVGSVPGVEEGAFQPDINNSVEADLPVSVEVDTVLVNEGDYVEKGTPLFRMTDNTADNLNKNLTDSLNQAEENAEAARNKLDSVRKNDENYTIKAPISGTVVSKKFKAGDIISKNSGADSELAVIYDLSELTFKLPVDELDIHKVKAGQEVAVSTEAFPGKVYKAAVTNVSLESTAANGVSTYPVIITLKSKENLIPGMNVEGVITLAKSENVLVIPAGALMRGDQVYVKDDKQKESQGDVPAGFRPVKVETGLISATEVEIKSGLSEGDEVYAAQPDTSSFGDSSMDSMGGDADAETME